MQCTLATSADELEDFRKDEFRATVLSLAECCPVDKCNPGDCPLHGVRKLKHPQRLQWLNNLSGDETAYLLAYHHVCLNAKLAEKA